MRISTNNQYVAKSEDEDDVILSFKNGKWFAKSQTGKGLGTHSEFSALTHYLNLTDIKRREEVAA